MGNQRHRSSDGIRWRAGVAIGVLAALSWVAACSPPAPTAADSSADDQATAQQGPQADQPPDPLANMVSAVSAAGSASPVSVKFRIETRPVIGMPVKIDVALIPDAGAQVSRVHGSFVPGDGLTLQSAGQFDLSGLQPGSAVLREVTVVPQHTGVLNLDATLLLQSNKSSESRTYTIPLIVADNSST